MKGSEFMHFPSADDRDQYWTLITKVWAIIVISVYFVLIICVYGLQQLIRAEKEKLNWRQLISKIE